MTGRKDSYKIEKPVFWKPKEGLFQVKTTK